MTPFGQKLAIVVGAIVLGALVVLTFGCYKGDPPCNPGTVDYPRCDPTQPDWAPRRDGGQG